MEDFLESTEYDRGSQPASYAIGQEVAALTRDIRYLQERIFELEKLVRSKEAK